MDDNELFSLLKDPRPELGNAGQWQVLFRLIYKSDMDPLRANRLHRMLYTVRSMGAVIKYTLLDEKIVPMIGAPGYWESGDEYIMRMELWPYRDDLKTLLKQLREVYFDEESSVPSRSSTSAAV